MAESLRPDITGVGAVTSTRKVYTGSGLVIPASAALENVIPRRVAVALFVFISKTCHSLLLPPFKRLSSGP
jgi:hypothetical protein